ncbi:metallophosphoesterase [Dysgonomonas sp. ZJ709]|uniref:metallophosphoesterase family protein n=1 Tax=Dysgonomonas sp. ZJ709 TaxID=2709797 RepID=UPI0013E9A8D5|nr:metallophosphoesterase [Dysgonomonas sp. ZJ709]
MNKILLIPLLLFLSYGCDMIEYHPYDGRITGETDINNKNIVRIENACAGKTTIRYAFMGDTQRALADTEDFVKTINNRTDIDFVIHGGDVADFGLTKEFIWTRDIMNKLVVPYVVLIGNHDCLANGEEVFTQIFGNPNFSFMAGNTKFICLNTNALEYDYSRPVPDFAFMKEQLEEQCDAHEKTVFAMHVRPSSEQFNNNVAEIFQDYIKKFPDLQFCMNAHDHNINIDDLFGDGIIYYGSPSMAKRKYFLFTLNSDNSYDFEVVEF